MRLLDLALRCQATPTDFSSGPHLLRQEPLHAFAPTG